MKINKIEIFNFRGIKYYSGTISDFDIGEKLTVLDGENGFGKTTIFDVIEFCFTGTIRRFGEIAKDNKPDTILKHSKYIDKESYVKIIFNDYTYISRKISSNQKGNLNDSENYVLDYTCDKSFLDIKHNFKNIFYVPQENPTELLKGSKGTFQSFFDIILDTSEEVKFNTNFDKRSNKILKLIENKISFLDNEIIKFDKIEENIKSKLEKIKGYEIEDINFINNDFIKNFDWYNIKTGTYNKGILFGNESSFIKSWRKLLDLFQNKSNLHQYFINESILSFKTPLLESKEVISNNYNYYLFYKESITKEHLTNLESIFFKYKGYKNNLDLLKINDKSLNNIDILFKNLSDKEDYYQELNEINGSFNNLKKSLNQKSKNEREYSDIFSNLIDFWENKFEKIEKEDLVLDNKNHTIKSDFCPLCMSEDKREDILEQLKFLKEKSGKIISESSKSFYSDLYNQELFNKLEEYVNYLDKEISKIKLLQEYKKDFEKFISLCKRYELSDIDRISGIDFKDEVKSEDKNIIIGLINNAILKLDDSYKDIENFSRDDYIKYKDIYFNLFSTQYSNKDNFLDNLNQDLITNNVKYFENEFKKISNKEKNDLELAEKLNKYKRDFFYDRKKFLEGVNIILGKYADLLDLKIKEYKKKKVNTIALPLYIFTQRIVKNYNGMGMILTENGINDESNGKNPLFTLSSGQAEGLSLALMLSNNINFDFDFETILIDDPIQSLDDLNILSFINLLRYQFSDKQIIISTHDDGFSRFIRYKFWRLYGKDSYKQINMKEKFKERNVVNV